ncbi:hypothetical protein A3197_12615 [Candidatus Thiodiazotropha endoloripes]|nr:hypothetical protein A3197_12615 [Candidatus Thiodiazotropha endoloripes]
MPAFMKDAMDVDGVLHQFIHDAVGVHSDFPYIFFADFRYLFAKAGRCQQHFHFVGDVLYDAGSVALGVVSDVLVNQQNKQAE